MPRSLVIAIGNPLRSDDAVAWHVAEELSRHPSTDVEILTVHQLTPDLAESLSQASRAVFFDASAEIPAGEIRCEELIPDGDSAEMRYSHHASPVALLAMARSLYGVRPSAFLVTCGGKNFEHGESLSDEVARAVPNVVAKVRELIASG